MKGKSKIRLFDSQTARVQLNMRALRGGWIAVKQERHATHLLQRGRTQTGFDHD